MNQPATILLVDDLAANRETLAEMLVADGYRLAEAADGPTALRLAVEAPPDLVLLDVMMPGMDGLEVCRRLRADARLAEVPVIMVTALNDEALRLAGLEAGADDFVSKPFKPDVLLARSRAVLRRAKPSSVSEAVKQYQDQHLFVDMENRRVLAGSHRISLTPTEYRLLVYMLRNAGRVLSFTQILENVWGDEYRDSPNYVHVYISHLRQKLEKDPRDPKYFVSEHGTGYRFVKQNLATG